MTPSGKSLAILAVLAFLVRPAAAQQNADERTAPAGGSILAPADFGVQDEGITIIDGSAFNPCSPGSDWFCTGINMVPNGALLTQIAFYVWDDSAAADFTGWMTSTYVHSATGGHPVSTALYDFETTGTPGPTVVYKSITQHILYREDVDGDGVIDVVSFQLQVLMDPGEDLGMNMVRLRWKRQVSPAPQTATFNDVPTNHLFFQFVEALVASGITAGCGGGNYCPDAPLTRGQMAVFLAKALGLHWPF